MELLKFEYEHRKFHRYIVWLIVLILFSNFIIYQPSIEGVIKTTFSDGSSDKQIIFPAGGGINDSVNVTIPAGTKIISASLNISSEPNAGEHPTNLILDVGGDGDYEWAFNGPGYGAMGYQTFFNNTQSSLVKRFSGTSGETLSSNIKLPKSADIESAHLSISGYITEFVSTTRVSSNIGLVYNCEVGDIDGDNNLDIVIVYRSQTSPYPTRLAWYENTIGDGSSWTAHTITSTGLYLPYGLAIGDLDGDNDLDIVVSDNDWNGRDILWYNNTNGLGTSWTVHNVRASIPGTSVWIYNLAVADMNNDTYLDVVGTLSNNDNSQEDVYWYSNDNGDGRTWTFNMINQTIIGARGLYIGDMDGDGDNDTAVTVIPTSGTDQIFWFSNDNGIGTVWNRYLINDTLSDPFAVVIADIDNDLNPDLAVIGGSNTVWFEAPDDPTLISNWKLHNIGVGGSWGGDIAVADIGYNHTGKKPDNNLDIIIVGRNSDDVIVFKNDGTPLDGGWVSIYLNRNHDTANWMTVGDVDGDSYIDTIAASSAWTTTIDDLIWYKYNGGLPNNVELKIGSDPQSDWVEPGVLEYTLQIPDFKSNLTQYLSNENSYVDEYGTRFVSIPIEVTSDTPGQIIIDQLKIKYNYTGTVNLNPNGDLASQLTKQAEFLTPDSSGNCSIPFTMLSSTGGKVELSDLKIEFNQKPWFISQMPDRLEVPEDSKDFELLDLSTFVDDDYLDPKDMSYNITSITGPGKDRVLVEIFNTYYLGVDSETGLSNNNWTGFLDVRFEVTDNFGSSSESEEIRIYITPVNDEPISGKAEYIDIIIPEGGESKNIDLDSHDYFIDVDSDPLYFSLVIDPDNKIKNENISFKLESGTNNVVFSSPNDWFGDDVDVNIFCDDSKPVNQTLFKSFKISVLNQNDPPIWKDIGDMVFNEDNDINDYINVNDYVYDIDDPNENLTFNVVSNSNSGSISVIINEDGYLDIAPILAEFAGSTMITIRATDPGQDYSDETFKITYLPVNDPPVVELISPRDNSVVPTDSIILRWDSEDVDSPKENLSYTINIGETSPPPEKQMGISGDQYTISDLKDSTIYYCQIIVTDGHGVGYSDIISFLTDTSVQPTVSLLNPKDNTILSTSDIEFKWKVIKDNNLDLLYDFYLDTDANPILEGLKGYGLSSTTFNVQGLQTGITYYWTVIPRFDTGFGVCEDGVRDFSIDTSKVTYGLEIIPSVNSIKIGKGESEVLEVNFKNIGLNQEEIEIIIDPIDFDKNMQRDIRTPTLTIVSGGDKTIKYTIDTTNIIPGEYTINFNATSIETPATASAQVKLEVVDPKTDDEKEDLFSDISTWIPIIIIIIIGILGAIAVIRYKPQEAEDSFEEALEKKLQEDLSIPKSELMLQTTGDELGIGIPPATLGAGQAQLPGTGMATSSEQAGAGVGAGQLPQLPPAEMAPEQVQEPATDGFEPMITGPGELELTEPVPTLEQGPEVLLPEDTMVEETMSTELETEEPGHIEDNTLTPETIQESEPSLETPPDIQMPELETGFAKTSTEQTQGPQFGESLKLQTAGEESEKTEPLEKEQETLLPQEESETSKSKKEHLDEDK
jgi:hypothetical protein